MKKLIDTLAICALAALPLNADVKHKKAGESIPSVQLLEADGTKFDLVDAVSGQPAVIVFYRGGWCPFCTSHLAELGRVEADLRELGFRILAVSPDRPEILKESIAKVREIAPDTKQTYTLLSDSQMEAAQGFGIAFKVDETLVRRYRENHNIDLEGASGQTHHLLPHPAVFIVTKDGTIRFAHVDTDYRARLSGEKVVAAAKEALGE